MQLINAFSAAVVTICFAASSAVIDKTKVLTNGSPVYSHDSIDSRLLRTHGDDGASAEHRTLMLSG
ncbi:RxLR effector protein [Phytophthora megakarya]|uniref:RxLR effector protein n=1 Tax=Phytophthora megakarya TaxID=4795 RepID=A0A225WQH2_9STRA|nr:RxLR effector protein [Phytophthora megakarya]